MSSLAMSPPADSTFTLCQVNLSSPMTSTVVAWSNRRPRSCCRGCRPRRNGAPAHWVPTTTASANDAMPSLICHKRPTNSSVANSTLYMPPLCDEVEQIDSCRLRPWTMPAAPLLSPAARYQERVADVVVVRPGADELEHRPLLSGGRPSDGWPMLALLTAL